MMLHRVVLILLLGLGLARIDSEPASGERRPMTQGMDASLVLLGNSITAEPERY